MRTGPRRWPELPPDMNSLEQAEDLKAFERRLTEYIHCLQPATGRWRMLLIVVSVCTATGAWNWLIDPETQKVSFFTSLWNHPFFTISCITLIGLFFAGIHKRVVAPSIIAARCRTVLAEYNMSCDDTGKLILKPRPHVQWQSTLIVLGLKTTFLQKVITAKSHKRLLLQLDMWLSEQQRTRKVQYLPRQSSWWWPSLSVLWYLWLSVFQHQCHFSTSDPAKVFADEVCM